MNLVNFTYHMQFSVIFINNNNPNTTRRMNIDVRDNQTMIREFGNFSRKSQIKSELERLQIVYDDLANTVRKYQTNKGRMDDVGSKTFDRDLRLKRLLNLKRKLTENATKVLSFSSKSKKTKRPHKSHVNIIERRRKKAKADVKKLIGLFSRNLSELKRTDVDLIRIQDLTILTGHRRNKRAMSILVRTEEDSDYNLVGLPNELAPKYHAMKKKQKDIRAYGKKYMNITNRNSEEELHFMNYTELQLEVDREKTDLIQEAQELQEFYELEEKEEDAVYMQNIASYHVDMSELELKCDLLNNVTGLEYRIHNPELYPQDSVRKNLEKLKVAEEKVYALERKQLEGMKARGDEWLRLSSLGRTTLKPNLTSPNVYRRSRYLADQEKIFGTLFKRFTRTRKEKEEAYRKLKFKPKTTHFRECWGLDYLENWYLKDKTFGDYGQDSNADFHQLREHFKSKLYSELHDGPYNYVNPK